jgi:RND superfamily putative drug exporter
VLERWTRGVIRFRLVVLAGWLLALAVGVVAASRLPPLLATSYAVPGTEADRAGQILARAFNEQPDGTFTVVFPVDDPSDKALRRRLRARLAAASAVVPTGEAGEIRDGTGILYGTVSTALEIHEAKNYTDALRRQLAADPRPEALVTGQPAIQHDVDPVITEDLRRGEAVALVIALTVLLVVLGVSPAVIVPFVFAACSIATTLAALYLLAHSITIATYVTSLVGLIGLGLAIDYSLLVVLRYREELADGHTSDDAVVRTMGTAGRTTVVSGIAVAIGLGLLILVPVPFVRSLGIGALLIPLASIVAMLTLQPALLSVLGRRGTCRINIAATFQSRLGLARSSHPVERDVDRGLWARLARAITRRPVPYLVGGVVLLLAAAAPAAAIEVTPGTLSGIPPSLESSRGYSLLRKGIGSGVVTPTSVIVDTGRAGGARRTDVRRSIDHLGDRLFNDFGLVALGSGEKTPYVDETARYARLIAAGREEYGAPSTRAFVKRLRSQDIPAARFPSDVEVVTGGAPPLGVDFLARAYDAFPWVVLAALMVTYVVLLRSFRSLLIPLKAVLLNTLTVAAVFGLLVVIFQWGAGAGALGLHGGEIEGWVPIFLFAVLFGLSMDYEIFIVSRMRESWDHVPNNERAISHGLQRTGPIVTAAAAIMAAAFIGFVVGRIAGLQQLGLGLALAVLIDATLVRAVLVPSAMAVLGRFNWWLPGSVARLARVSPSPLRETRIDTDRPV